MLSNYLVTALRNLRKYRLYTFINVLGLSIGITCCLVEYAVLRHELNFDAFHEKGDRIFRVVRNVQNEGGLHYSGMIPNPMGAALESEMQIMEDVIVMHGPSVSTIELTSKIGKKEIFKERGILMTNSAFLRNLDFTLIEGRPIEALDEPNQVYLTERIAKKYYGAASPVGQLLTYDEKHVLEIAGVVADPPTNTNTPFQFLVSHQTVTSQNYDWMESWGSFSSASAYVVAPEGTTETELIREIKTIVDPHLADYTKDKTIWKLQPLSDIHTNELYEGNSTYTLPSKVLYGSIALVVVILLVSILNFVNLSTAQAVKRSKK